MTQVTHPLTVAGFLRRQKTRTIAYGTSEIIIDQYITTISFGAVKNSARRDVSAINNRMITHETDSSFYDLKSASVPGFDEYIHLPDNDIMRRFRWWFTHHRKDVRNSDLISFISTRARKLHSVHVIVTYASPNSAIKLLAI